MAGAGAAILDHEGEAMLGLAEQWMDLWSLWFFKIELPIPQTLMEKKKKVVCFFKIHSYFVSLYLILTETGVYSGVKSLGLSEPLWV